MAQNRQTTHGCPCGSGESYSVCCQPWHQGMPAPTATILMRSRYCAYVLGLEPYLLDTWHISTRPPSLALAAEPKPQWLGLDIKHSAALGEDAATVEFIARYKVGGKAHRLHEISRFERTEGQWYYLDGVFPA